jgi:hypothetical protein
VPTRYEAIRENFSIFFPTSPPDAVLGRV